MEENELVNLEVSSDDEHISLTRHYDTPAPTMMAAPTAGGVPVATEAKENAKAGSVETSPMVGVFYSAPSPNDPPFVKIGQKYKLVIRWVSSKRWKSWTRLKPLKVVSLTKS